MSLSAIPRPLRVEVFERDGGRCRYCRLSQTGQGTTFHINHVVPKAKGGATTIANLVLQCPHCSLHKSDRTTSLDPEGGSSILLFHPLQQEWTQHFVMLSDGTCMGLSPTGRATVTALDMNSGIPRMARAIQLAIGLI